MMIEVRKEETRDQDDVCHLNLTAFDNNPEATLVDKLRVACKDSLSFIAVEDSAVVGHIDLGNYNYHCLGPDGVLSSSNENT